ncbi:MAG TPA: hypothetical protein VGG39_22390 [Polyangiaceae bacterium]|jgi:hypothetical protein
MRTSLFAVATLSCLVACSFVSGCGSSSKGGGGENDAAPEGGGLQEASTFDAGGTIDAAEAGDAPSGDAGDDGGDGDGGLSGYPAFPPFMPTLAFNKGPVLKTMRIVTVTWASDANAPQFDAFDDAIGASTYWQSLAEYGVGPSTSVAADHVSITTAPTSPWDDGDIETWASGMINGAPGNGWPAPDANTMYIVYVPDTVEVTQSGQDACLSEGGYHTELNAGPNPGGQPFALILDECAAQSGESVIDFATTSASHELAETATDPFPGYEPAYVGFDQNHLAWDIWNEFQDEVADACEFFEEGYFTGGSDLPYGLARVWSNASGQAGHDPCVPVPSGAYNNVTPLGLSKVTIQTQGAFGALQSFETMGWRIAPGQTITENVGFYTDGPASKWQVQHTEGDCCFNDTKYLTVTPPTFIGNNGDTVPIQITVNSAPAAGTGTGILLTFVSAAPGGIQHFMPVVIEAD